MECAQQTSPLRIEAPDQVAAFEHPLRSRLLLACARQERSLLQLQLQLGHGLSGLHYHVGRLLRCGLLRVSRTAPRAGRPVRFYRAAAERFLVSRDALSAGVGERLSAELRRSLDDLAGRREVLVLYELDDQGQVRVTARPASASASSPSSPSRSPPSASAPPRARDYWKILPLTPAQRLALARDIEELLRRYEPPPGDKPAAPAAEPYILHAAFAPRRPPHG